jgi:tetrachlorobenzoquinone reductase
MVVDEVLMTDDISLKKDAKCELIDVLLKRVDFATKDINLFELGRPNYRPLLSIDAGAHIDLHLPNGMVRQYSLLSAASDPRTYVIGVKREENGRGGSLFMHQALRAGDQLRIGSPRNNFPLTENAKHTILIAGGIGITPIWCMLNRLQKLGQPWQLYYSCRSASQAMFFDELSAHRHVRFHFDDQNEGRILDLNEIVRQAPKHSHFYCCGPPPMMSAFERATEGWPPEQVHTEYFSNLQQTATERRFVVQLARSGKEVIVEPGNSILKALREAGYNVPYSCESGICGTCEMRVLAGIPDHRDNILTDAERALNTKIMICCSGSLGDRLVLDL